MPRIRSIKPEFWTSEQIIECSSNARLLFIGLWTFCDDTGRHPYAPRQIKAEVFPADDISTDDVERMLDELSSNDLIRRYAVEGKEYFYVTGWHHQKIDRPQKPKYPEPLDERSTNARPRYDTIGEDRKELPPEPGASRETYSKTFEELWGVYKPIAAKNATKIDASRAFDRLSEDERRLCVDGLRAYVQWLKAERERRSDTPAKHLATFINKRGWEPFEERLDNGEPVTWLTKDDPLWSSVAERYQERRGKPAIHYAGRGGMGFHFPADLVLEIPPGLRREAISASTG